MTSILGEQVQLQCDHDAYFSVPTELFLGVYGTSLAALSCKYTS